MPDTISRRSLFAGALGLAGAALVGRDAAAIDDLDETPTWAQYEPPTELPDLPDRLRVLDILHRISRTVWEMYGDGKHAYEVRLHPDDVELLRARHLSWGQKIEFGRSRRNEYGGFDGEIFSVAVVPCPLNPPGSIEIAYHGGPNWELKGATN